MGASGDRSGVVVVVVVLTRALPPPRACAGVRRGVPGPDVPRGDREARAGLHRPVRSGDAMGRVEAGEARAVRTAARSFTAGPRIRVPRRPTPLYFAKRLTEKIGGAQIWLKREDLAHTGAHKINNALGQVRRGRRGGRRRKKEESRVRSWVAPSSFVLGLFALQALLAKKIGKHRIIAETGAGQHGVATATACALLDLDCTVYMGEEVRQFDRAKARRKGGKEEGRKSGTGRHVSHPTRLPFSPLLLSLSISLFPILSLNLSLTHGLTRSHRTCVGRR